MKGREVEDIADKSCNLHKIKADNLAKCSIAAQDSQRYNPRHDLEKEKPEVNEMEKSLAMIDALFKKGILNVETWDRIHKKYGRTG